MSGQSAAVCPVCGARRALLQRYCNSCEEVATDCVYLALSIRRFVRRAEVAEAADDATRNADDRARLARDAALAYKEGFVLEGGRLQREAAEAARRMSAALSRLAELALEDR